MDPKLKIIHSIKLIDGSDFISALFTTQPHVPKGIRRQIYYICID